MTQSSVLFSEKEVTAEDAKDHNLTAEEFEMIKEFLGGRTPTVTELGIYSGLWSEHASYKNSILQLKRLPTESPLVISKAGEENAGALDIGDGQAVVFKIESHNHPTAIEPYQGAATGVGGIMRDIFTMGARPICSLNSLRFGPPSEPRNRYLLSRAVKGIGDYGNSLGIAVSGGELFFDESFSRNCLVNAMTVGIVDHKGMASAKASGAGNPVYYVGATTGRDGIHGASFASQDLTAESESRRSAVQVGDPFMEKLLMEATLELIASKAVVGIQDMGAAGLSCATSEMSAKGNMGMDIDLDLVPLREEGMSAYEIMLSESQERMLVVLEKGSEHKAEAIFEKWDLHCVKIGEVTDDGMLRLRRHGKLCAEIPADSLVLGGGAPRYKREVRKPEYLDQVASWDPLKDPEIRDFSNESEISAFFTEFIGSMNLASRRPLYEQYDTEVGLVKVIGPGADGGIARIPGTNKGIGTATDCNSRYVYLNPRRGAAQAVAEAARNVAVTGCRPIGVTNNLNFANPYIPENYYIFTECITGMSEACRELGLPVTGGNVSFYNESADGPIYPTPTIGMVGLIKDLSKTVYPYFKEPGHRIYLTGLFRPVLGGSEYLKYRFRITKGDIPELIPEYEKKLIEFMLHLAENRLAASMQDISIGGLARTLFKSAYNPDLRMLNGFRISRDFSAEFTKTLHWRNDVLWFGETNGSAIVSVAEDKKQEFEKAAESMGILFLEIGEVTGGSDLDFGTFRVPGELAVNSFESGLYSVFGHEF